MSKCSICPRNCNADRINGEKGVCGVCGEGIYVSRAALHMWEEPCISGRSGSGTIFFSGCNLKCVYCQNNSISRGICGKEVSVDRLSDICMELEKKGANNINLVTPTHYALHIRDTIVKAREKGLKIPIVYNSSGYESCKTLNMLNGLIDIFLVDFKYIREETARRYSKAKDYPKAAKDAISCMVKQTGSCRFNNEGLMRKGVIVRHLLIPGHVAEGKEIIKYLYDTYGNNIYVSIMNQYTPVSGLDEYPEINRKVTKREYDRLVNYAIELGIQNAYIQEGDTAAESFIPSFDCEGV